MYLLWVLPSPSIVNHQHSISSSISLRLTIGPHFNPHNATHGGPSASIRHVGDLGNIDTNSSGAAKGTVEDKYIKLIGPESVIGRMVVVHAGEDDLGKGGNEESLKTGNAGGRAACGVIGVRPLSHSIPDSIHVCV